jgi:hypothetical protein
MTSKGCKEFSSLLVHANDKVIIYSHPWRIAGWIGSVIFEGAVMALTGIRAIRLRMSGHRVSIVESMLQAGIYYFGKHTSIEVHVATNQQFPAAIVFGLHISMVITFVTVECAAQLVFQRMTQVLTVVMISHMFLNLRAPILARKKELKAIVWRVALLWTGKQCIKHMCHSTLGLSGQRRCPTLSEAWGTIWYPHPYRTIKQFQKRLAL